LKSQVPDLAFDATAGLSLGEFTALAAADVVSFDDGLRMVQSRGRFMQEACEATNGGMASILSMDDTALAEVCDAAEVDIANINCPAGRYFRRQGKDRESHRAGQGEGREAGHSVGCRGRVSFTTHGRRKGQSGGGARRFAMQLPKVPVVPTSRPVRRRRRRDQGIAGAPGHLAGSLERVHAVASCGGFTRFIELGPGNVLSGLMKRINKDVEMLSVSDVPTLDATVAKLKV